MSPGCHISVGIRAPRWHDGFRCAGRSRSPTVAPGSRSPRTRFAAFPCGARVWARRGSRPTPGSAATARWSCPRRPGGRRGCAGRRCAAPHRGRTSRPTACPGSRSCTRRSAPAFELSVDAKTSRGHRADARGGIDVRAHDALDRLWVCSPYAELLFACGRSAARCSSCIPTPGRASATARASRVATSGARCRRDQLPPHRVDRGPRVAVPPLRRARVRLGRARGTSPPGLLAMGIDAVYCDRPDRMVEHGRGMGHRVAGAGQKVCRRFNGQIRMKTRPTMLLFGIAPNSRESRGARLSPITK